MDDQQRLLSTPTATIAVITDDDSPYDFIVHPNQDVLLFSHRQLERRLDIGLSRLPLPGTIEIAIIQIDSEAFTVSHDLFGVPPLLGFAPFGPLTYNVAITTTPGATQRGAINSKFNEPGSRYSSSPRP